LTEVKVAALKIGDKRIMSMLRALLCLVTVLSLALSGVASAAQSVHGPITEMVICGDGGVQTIRLDAKGNPVERGQCCDCPQCLMLADALPVERGDCALAILRRLNATSTLAARQPPAAVRHAQPLPRGPPSETAAGCDIQPQSGLSPATLEFGQVPRGVAVATDGQPSWVAR
jgi:hypothetical protein